MAMMLNRTQEGSETWNKDGKPTEFEIRYFVTDPTDKTSAMRAVFDDAPVNYGELAKSGVRFENYDDDGNMEISVLYADDGSVSLDDDDDDDEDEAVLNFNCSGGTKHLVHAISQKKVYPTSSSDDSGGAIGWNGKTGKDMEITGIDVPTGQLSESYSKKMRMRKITTAKRRAWNSLVGKVNKSAFKGWAPGEVMFLGCSFSGSENSSSKITVQFDFKVQENESSAKVNNISCGAKKGFDAIWSMPDSKKNNDGKPEAKVKGIYIATVCKTADFRILGI